MSEARLRRFVGLVERWSPKINLVSRHDLAALWERHVLDSLALAPLIPADVTHGIDLGSGAGFPGLVLAIATGIPFTLIESDGRKCAFLVEAARETAAPVLVIGGRIEAAQLPAAPLVTARALAPLDRLLGLAAPHVAAGGVCLLPKGRNVEAELTAARRLWQMEVARFPGHGPDACILKVSNIRHVGAG